VQDGKWERFCFIAKLLDQYD